MVFDGDVSTGWSEGAKGDGAGEELWLVVRPGTDTLALINGFARSAILYEKNNRVAKLNAAIYGGIVPPAMVTEFGRLFLVTPLLRSSEILTVSLEDTDQLQTHKLALNWSRITERFSGVRSYYEAESPVPDVPPGISDTAYLLHLRMWAKEGSIPSGYSCAFRSRHTCSFRLRLDISRRQTKKSG